MNSDLFHAMSHPCRREIIRLLRWQNLSAGEIVAHFDMAQPSVSRHLDVLKKAELVTAERRGTQMIYSLNLSTLQEVLLYVTELLEDRGGKAAPHEA